MNNSQLASRFVVCVIAVLFLCGCTKHTDDPPNLNSLAKQDVDQHAALREAAKYLVAQQSAEDGNWYSNVYGMFNKSNQSPAPTALAVYALAHLPAEVRQEYEPTIRAVLDRLRSQITEKGFVGNANGGAHYPTYVTGMVLATYQRLNWELPDEDEQAMIRYLESAQLSQSRGWRPEDPHFGGWDLLGDQMIERQVDGPGTNVSVTSFALEGLRPTIERALSDEAGTSLAEFDETKAVAVFAVGWLDRLQQASTQGGFAFGPDPFSNKAGFEKSTDDAKNQPQLNSYGSATCDGLRSLAYLGIDADDSRAEAAESWLIRHDSINRVPGFDVPGFEDASGKDWQQSLYYYYTMSLAKVYRLYPQVGTLTRRSRLATHLVKLQRPDGSWVNTASGMREDDPLIATSFALIALAEATAEN